MRIGIYVDVAQDDRPTGIGKHIVYLLQALAEIDRENEYLLYYATPLFGARSEFKHRPAQANFRSRGVAFPAGWQFQYPRAWWNYYLPWILKRDGIDLFHGPNHLLPAFDKRRNIVTIHDLAYFHMKVHGERQDQDLQRWTRHAFEHANKVIALSENTKRDTAALGVPADDIRVIYGGGNIVPEEKIAHSRRAEMIEKLRLPPKFILFIGALQPRKNVPFLVRGYDRLRKEHGVEHHLVLAGPQDSATEEIRQLVAELGLGDHVHFTGYLEDWQIPLLYKEAELFVLPTRYEGFTLVTLEAMAYGTPLVATNSSSIREGVGDAALLVEVDEVNQLAAAMHRGLTDSALRSTLIEQGKAQSAKFTWRRCATETLALYQEVYNGL